MECKIPKKSMNDLKLLAETSKTKRNGDAKEKNSLQSEVSFSSIPLPTDDL